MKASTPRELPELFLQGLNAGDVEAVLALYEPDGVVAADPSQPLHGHQSIRAMLTSFLAQHPRFDLHDSEVVEAGDIALIRVRWTATTTDAAGQAQAMKVAPTLLARRQADGHWLVVIDRPLVAD